MPLTNPDKVVTEERLAEFYQQILPYLGGMPDVMMSKFSKSDIYSLEERMVGVWHDGKPLYQKVVTGTTPSNSSWYTTAALDNTCHIVFGQMYVKPTTNEIRPIPYGMGNVRCVYNINDTNGSVGINVGSDNAFYNIPYYVTLQYTKTTDSPVVVGDADDYDDTEKIVGTWFGKPVWQKTVIDVPVNTTIVTGVDTLIDYTALRFVSSGLTGYYTIADGNSATNDIIAIIQNGNLSLNKTGSSYTAGNLIHATVRYTKTS